MSLSEDQISIWQADLERLRSDPNWLADCEKWRTTRSTDRVEGLRGLLARFLSGEIDLPTFQGTFDKKSRKEWDIFGIKGMSGAMFLNTLVKYMPVQAAVDRVLKDTLSAPTDEDSARQRMSDLAALIDHATATHQVKKIHVQSSRSAFFLSVWWHIQDHQAWPPYYVSIRRVFEARGIWNMKHANSVEDYLTFRRVFIDLQNALGVEAWDLEWLCLEFDKHPAAQSDKVSATPESESTDPPASPSPAGQLTAAIEGGKPHTQAQLLLAKLGKRFGCKVWIAQNDHGHQWNGEKLGTYSIPSLPTLGIGDPAQSIVRHIDVIWLKGNLQVVAAFEIESSTSIYSGLLRMSDLAALAPNISFPIYIVAPEVRMEKVREQLRRPTFQRLELHQRCRFFSMEELIASSAQMLKWATDAGAINQLAQQVDDLDEDQMQIAMVEDD